MGCDAERPADQRRPEGPSGCIDLLENPPYAAWVPSPMNSDRPDRMIVRFRTGCGEVAIGFKPALQRNLIDREPLLGVGGGGVFCDYSRAGSSGSKRRAGSGPSWTQFGIQRLLGGGFEPDSEITRGRVRTGFRDYSGEGSNPGFSSGRRRRRVHSRAQARLGPSHPESVARRS